MREVRRLTLDDGSTTATLFGLEGAIMTFDAAGGAMRAKVPGGGVLLKDADALTLTGDGGDLQVEGGLGGVGGGRMSMSGGSYGEERMFFARAIEQIEYEPYGTPSIHTPGSYDSAWRRTVSSYHEREGQESDSFLSAVDAENASHQGGKASDSAALSSIGLKFLYTGRSWHAATEQYYYRARWYEPEAGRFLSKDPIGYSGGANQYVYVLGNPLSYIDPTGLTPEGEPQVDPVVKALVKLRIDELTDVRLDIFRLYQELSDHNSLFETAFDLFLLVGVAGGIGGGSGFVAGAVGGPVGNLCALMDCHDSC